MIDDIKKLGLNEYEARAYRVLLSSGGSTAIAVSRKGGIPRARVYDVLFSLEKKGFAAKSLSKPVEFSALSPTTAVEVIAKSSRRQLDASLSELGAIAESLERSSVKGSETFSESVMLLEGRRNIYAAIAGKLGECSKSVVMSSSEEGLGRKREYFGERLRSLSRDGVRIASVPSSELRCMVFDRNCVLFFLNDGKDGEEQEKALLISSPFVANYFHSALMQQ